MKGDTVRVKSNQNNWQVNKFKGENGSMVDIKNAGNIRLVKVFFRDLNATSDFVHQERFALYKRGNNVEYL